VGTDVADDRTRRQVLGEAFRWAGLAATGGTLAALATRSEAKGHVWQIDPEVCVQCGECAAACVLTPSAVKCIHAYALCGYCELCFGVYRDARTGDATAAENVRCPVDAIKRRFVEDPYYQISVDEAACIGCALCVKGCGQFGNASLFLQIRHDRCANCNQCAAAHTCPSGAIQRVPADRPYIVKRPKQGA
jgi:electron transport complex protein RnfB